MEELKPVAWLCIATDGENVDAVCSEFHRSEYERFGREIVPLYAIPDGCVVVHNGAVEKAFRDGFMQSAEGYNGELYCDGWTKVIDGFKEAAAEYKAMLEDAKFPRGSVVDDNA